MKLTRPILYTALLCLTACRPETEGPRRYREIGATAPPPPVGALPDGMAESAPGSVEWDAPPGWKETRGTGMRRTSFNIASPQGEGVCTVVMLGGEAGGMEANVLRWLGQLEIIPDPEQLRAYLVDLPRVDTRDGTPAVMVDLTGFVDASDPAVPGMLAAVWSRPNQSVFIKFTGPLGLLASEREGFVRLVQSLR